MAAPTAGFVRLVNPPAVSLPVAPPAPEGTISLAEIDQRVKSAVKKAIAFTSLAFAVGLGIVALVVEGKAHC